SYSRQVTRTLRALSLLAAFETSPTTCRALGATGSTKVELLVPRLRLVAAAAAGIAGRIRTGARGSTRTASQAATPRRRRRGDPVWRARQASTTPSVPAAASSDKA